MCDEKQRLDQEDARIAAEKADEYALDEAEHDVFLMLHSEPEKLMAIFHDGATEADLDLRDSIVTRYLINVGEHEESPLYDAMVRIVKELN